VNPNLDKAALPSSMRRYPCQLNGLISLLSAKWNLKNETLTVFKEQDKQQITLYEKSFLINKVKKINLN